MPNISKSRLLALHIPVPPVDLQNRFSEIVKTVRQIKSKLLRSSNEVEKLTKSLSNLLFQNKEITKKTIKENTSVNDFYFNDATEIYRILRNKIKNINQRDDHLQ